MFPLQKFFAVINAICYLATIASVYIVILKFTAQKNPPCLSQRGFFDVNLIMRLHLHLFQRHSIFANPDNTGSHFAC